MRLPQSAAPLSKVIYHVFVIFFRFSAGYFFVLFVCIFVSAFQMVPCFKLVECFLSSRSCDGRLCDS